MPPRTMRDPATSPTKDQAAAATEADDILPPIDDDADPEIAPERGAAAAPAPDAPPAEPPPPRTDEGRDAIVRRFRELRAQEDSKSDEPDAEPEPEAEPPVEPAAGEMSPAPSASGPSQQPVEVELVIDGKTVKKPIDEVVRLAQMSAAGDNRLEEAKRVLTETQTLARRVLEHQQAQPPAPSPDLSRTAPAPEHPPAQGLDPETLKDIVERIQVGDSDAGAQAVAELVELVNTNRPVPQQIPPQMIGALVQHYQRQHETQQEIDGALNRFGEQFPEIAKDADYRGVGYELVAREMRSDLRQAGLTDDDLAPLGLNARALAQAHRLARQNGLKVRTYTEVLDSVGNYMSAKFGIKPTATSQQSQPPTTQQRAPDPSLAARQRLDAKRAAPQQPRTAGVRIPAAAPPRPLTPREKVEQMRAARGFERTA